MRNDEQLQESLVWTTKRVDELFNQIDDGKDPKHTPFWDGKPEWRNANIVFEYTTEELEEIEKCAADAIYFSKYCKVMTDDGIQNILLRDYQIDILKDFTSVDDRYSILKSARQIGKTIVTGIALSHYLLFNTDKNLMVLSNNGATTTEILDKIKVIISNLPFFLKPGILKNDVMTMKFDNGNRLFGRTTTKSSGISFTIHMLYVDEFAHIHPNILEPLWRSVFPTLSSSLTSRCIITSTPNGLNKFYDIFIGALEGRNEFKAMQVDWWQVPGRDEAWRLKEIANLGSEEDFNQEHGGQFISSSKLLLDVRTLINAKTMITDYRWLEIEDLSNIGIDYSSLKWHSKFSFDNVKPTDRFVFSIDTAGGGGGKSDYSIINIFKLIPTPYSLLENITSFSDEADFFSLLQVGMFRSNTTDIENLVILTDILLHKVFGTDNVKIVLEMDFKGNIVYERMSRHQEFYDDIIIHTKHSENSTKLKPGIKLNVKNKFQYCMDMRRFVRAGRIITNEKNTFNELTSFGINKTGTYSSQIGHDDCCMTVINLSSFFSSQQYFEMIEDIYDTLDDKYKNAISTKIKVGENTQSDDLDLGFLKSLMD